MDEELADKYICALIAEIEERCKDVDIDTIFIGGGNPFSLNDSQLSFVLESALKAAPKFTEFTVECNPESLTKHKADVIINAGVNRVSLGLQSHDDSILKAIGRRHSYKDFLSAVRLLREKGIGNINADIMLGLPNQTLGSVKETVSRLMDLGIEHVSAYSLKVEKGTPLYNSGYRPNGDLQADMYDAVRELLGKAEYNRYEVSNFAKCGYECKHNFKYWQVAPYIGCGLSAHSMVDGIRMANISDIDKYLNGELIKGRKKANINTERIMLGLRLEEGIEYGLLADKKQQLDYLTKANLITIQNDRVKISKDKFYISNGIIAELI